MVLGITTRSDAAKMLPDYEQALATDELNRKLLRFGAVSGVFNEATNKFTVATDMWLDAMQRMNDFASMLAQVASEKGLDQVITRDIEHADGVPYSNLNSAIAVQPLRAVTHGDSKAYVFRYVYNPLQAVIAAIIEAQALVNTAYTTGKNNGDKIEKMRLAARAMNTSGTVRLVNFAYRTNVWLAYQMERDPKHQVNVFVQGNEEIVAASDITLRFDEMYFETHNSDPMLQSISSTGVLDPTHRTTYAGLFSRQMVRDEINRILATRNKVVINGVDYRPVLRNGSLVCETNRESSTVIASIIGKPVLPPRGCLLRPDGWAINEIRWVSEYRHNPCDSTAQPLIDRYSFSGDPQLQLQQLIARNPMAAF